MNKNFYDLCTKAAARSLRRSSEMFNSLSDMIDDFDFDDFEEKMEARRKGLLKRFDDLSELSRKVKETLTSFTFKVPFDPETETLEHEIEGNVLTVKTLFETETSKKTTTNQVTIPEAYDIDGMKVDVDSDSNQVIFTFPVLRAKKEGPKKKKATNKPAYSTRRTKKGTVKTERK